MGRVFVSVGHRGIDGDRNSLAATVDHAMLVREMNLIRDLMVQSLRSANYDVLAVPDDLNTTQAIDWINARSRSGDVALELCSGAFEDFTTRGAALFYIASNSQRRTQAEQVLQTYLRRIPQMYGRGVKPDTQNPMGRVSFCRQVAIPSLLLEVGCLTNPDDRQMIQSQRQDVVLGIAEGLATWSRMVALSQETTYPVVDVTLNGALYEKSGILITGNPCIPVDLIDQLGIDLPPAPAVHRVSYRHVVYVRAIELRDLNVSVSWDSASQTIGVRSALVYPDQLDRIMGRGSTSDVQLIMFLKSHNPDGLSQFSDLPKLYREEAAIEGVNYDMAFAQMCVETNFLRFGGAVKPDHNNFAGLGDADNTTEGVSFSSARVGIRAHIQHLKAYASTEPLVQAIVDPRFHCVRRGVAPLIDQLSGRWSAHSDYGIQIRSMMRLLYESAGFL
jgi:hypothetical protein